MDKQIIIYIIVGLLGLWVARKIKSILLMVIAVIIVIVGSMYITRDTYDNHQEIKIFQTIFK